MNHVDLHEFWPLSQSKCIRDSSDLRWSHSTLANTYERSDSGLVSQEGQSLELGSRAEGPAYDQLLAWDVCIEPYGAY